MTDNTQTSWNAFLEDLIPAKPDIMSKHLISKCANASEEAKGDAKKSLWQYKTMEKLVQKH